jgi:thiosulfate dehydrogenase (quinone) large subunit
MSTSERIDVPAQRDRKGSAIVHTDASFRQFRRTVDSLRRSRYATGVLRLSLGWVFLWAFLDKTFALGFDTGRNLDTGVVTRFGDAAWINGGSPTLGFLKFGTEGPFAGFYQGFAGATWADWLFMIGLLGIGLALMLGVAMRITTVAGVALLAMMWSAALPTANNPFMDDHVIYAITLVTLLLGGAGATLGMGKAWNRLDFVQRHGFLR